jgi:hypothetical protein
MLLDMLDIDHRVLGNAVHSYQVREVVGYLDLALAL